MTGFVAHLDADCFYVSAERVRHPDLIGKPVGVLGNNGACVIAKSYEMKAAGVKTGTPIWDAKRLCPDGVYVKRDFYWYEVLSRKMLAIVGDCSPRVEYYSIDEFFFHVEPLRVGQPVQATAERIRDRILREAGLPVTIGIARTRTLAKLFSDTGKPFGAVAVLTKERERELLARLPVTEISGIGQRRADRLLPYGIRTCLDLADADGGLVKRLLIPTAPHLRRVVYTLTGERPAADDPDALFARLRSAATAAFPPVPDPRRRCPAVCTAVALPASELPDEIVAGVPERVHTRGEEREVRFDWRNRPALLPVWWEGRLQLLRWGNRDRGERKLPLTGWTWRETVEAGRWAGVEPQPVEVPAGYALMNGVWFKVKRGLRGLVVRTPAGEPVVYLLCEPATRYYQVMTRADWMPVLIGEVI